MYSQIADVSYKSLTREIAVPAAGGSMTFWTSYDTEAEWDHLFVEARTPGVTTGHCGAPGTRRRHRAELPAGWVGCTRSRAPPSLGRVNAAPRPHHRAWNAATGTRGLANGAKIETIESPGGP